MTPEECEALEVCRELADITGCNRLGDAAESGAEWCETHGNDWPCQVGRLYAVFRAYADQRVARAVASQ